MRMHNELSCTDLCKHTERCRLFTSNAQHNEHSTLTQQRRRGTMHIPVDLDVNHAISLSRYQYVHRVYRATDLQKHLAEW